MSYLSDLLLIDAQEIDVTVPFDRYGLDSASAIGLTGDLQEWLAVLSFLGKFVIYVDHSFSTIFSTKLSTR
ncbi:MAG: acyl carrier protein [Xenococcaceae cyanobacterium MO_188.B29]|nr:acyl carrier protein [Xenococcaceae cyanobacterium MO_188.B29]